MNEVVKETWSNLEASGLSLLQDFYKKSQEAGVVAEFYSKNLVSQTMKLLNLPKIGELI